jgi:hypothetical protein
VEEAGVPGENKKDSYKYIYRKTNQDKIPHIFSNCMVNISVLGFRTKSNFASDNVYQLLAHMVRHC